MCLFLATEPENGQLWLTGWLVECYDDVCAAASIFKESYTICLI